MAYIETLFGHQAAVTGIDCCLKERPSNFLIGNWKGWSTPVAR
ncbi:MAG: hypothetical protein ACREOZ_03630 [Gloeomargaritales cyanobacterium]